MWAEHSNGGMNGGGADSPPSAGVAKSAQGGKAADTGGGRGDASGGVGRGDPGDVDSLEKAAAMLHLGDGDACGDEEGDKEVGL